MSRIVIEALLEMYFFQTLKEHYNKLLGPGYISIHKPSPQKEAWIGYDQGWVKSKVPMDQFYNRIRQDIQNGVKSHETFYKGFFLQFKIVDRIYRNSKYKPFNYKVPYFRSEISCKPNKITGRSQHNTLKLLSEMENANVQYACCMVFEDMNIYEDADFTKLRMVSLKDASYYPDNPYSAERHFITFQTQTDINPIFNSELYYTKSYPVDDWIIGKTETSPKKLNAKQILKLIRDTDSFLKEIQIRHYKTNGRLIYIDEKTRKRETEEKIFRHPFQNFFVIKFFK